ncbi:Phosphoglycerate mutase-like protein [Rhynchospora pubera]|uniref:Phosphoglycerate mutase-like protein n=1 Tax=Rhynchospora pubera TaxID=906938 RepID=A0AAV8F857_9POAL|nr:Phosphoglycerate mutase-like protein [Rhynchospora pubera]
MEGGMTDPAGLALYPSNRCKTLYLIRHGQAVHNVAGEKNHKAYSFPEFFDAQLSPLGWDQVDNLRKHVNACGVAKKIELVVVSPLLRTMQTAVGVFGGDKFTNTSSLEEEKPLMVENAGNSSRHAISSSNSPPFIAVEYCRERMGRNACDKRRSITEYSALFPGIDFSQIENNEDVYWKPDSRETDEQVAARGVTFFKWLWSRTEKEIAVVTHSAFLLETLRLFGNDTHPSIKTNEISHPFSNCELRSMVLVDTSMLGSDVPIANYP